MNRKGFVSHWLPCPVVFISTAHGGKRDIMTASAMFISEKDSLLAVSLAKDHLTARLAAESGAFTLAMASEGQKDLVWQFASVSGDETDKFERFSVQTLSEKPLVPKGSAAWMECQVVSRYELGGYVLFTARVVDQKNLGAVPLIWQQDAVFVLKKV